MDDALLVRFFQGLGDLPGHGDGLIDGNRAAAQPLRQVVAGHEFHHQAHRSIRLFEAVDGGDVGMIQGGEDLRLAPEPAHALDVLSESGGKDLDRDVTPELRIVRAEDFAHASGSDGCEDLIGPEPCS